MTDYTSQGAAPVDDAATDDPPTVDEVRERQERDHPEQARERDRGAGSPGLSVDDRDSAEAVEPNEPA
jgi:hypothetical protein